MARMKAAIFVEPGRIVLDEKPVPDIGPLDALIRITTTTICGTDVHILKGEYPVAKGLTIGHEPVGVIEKLGSAVEGFREGPAGDRGRDHPERHEQCLSLRLLLAGRRGHAAWLEAARRLEVRQHHRRAQAEYLRVPDAMANLAPVPDGLTDEQVLMCPDIMSTGFGGAERGGIRIGDMVAVFAQGRSGSAPPPARG
jgi:alcohol dehydrogenase